MSTAPTATTTTTGTDGTTSTAASPPVFCHTFDLTKRLTHPNLSKIQYIPIPPVAPTTSPFTSILQRISTYLASSAPNTVHRLVIPSLLSPALYPPQSSNPTHLLPFLHGLRALLSTHSSQLTCIITLPLSLFPRSSALIRWLELLSDGVIELAPFPASSDAVAASSTTTASSTSTAAQEEPPQGMLKVHRLPIFHEKGGVGGIGFGEDWAFTLSRRKFLIKPFSLPPVEGDEEAQRGEANGPPKKADLEF